MRIVFMGTPKPAADCLKSLISAQEEIVCVVTQPDRKKGRGLHTTPSPVRELAEKFHIPVETPEKVKDHSFISKIKSYAPDLIIVVAYGKILPKEIIDMPKHGAINVHASLLPKYRGAAPIQWALMNGETETGITVMQIAETLDTGDIILQDKVIIEPDDNSEMLQDKLFNTGARTLLKAVEQIKNGSAKRVPQKDHDATYAELITKETGEIDWRKKASEISDKARALVPWPTAHTYYKGKMLKIKKAEAVPMIEKLKPGEISDMKSSIVIACGEGGLLLKRVQYESGREMPAQDFVRGHKLNPKEILPN